MFRRRKKDGQADEPEVTQDAVDAAEDGDAEPAPAAPGRPQGPWDEADAPDDGRNRLDLGGLRVPVPPETEVRVDVSSEGEVVAATLVRAQSAMQVNAFAAPRTEGIWDEVRAEIAEALVSSGGEATDADGPFGVELRAKVPTQVPDRGVVLQPARFLGVDGPRWFLRALLTGPAALDPAAAGDLEAALRDIVVVRGNDPLAVRDALPLRLPKEVTEQQEAAAAQEAADQQEQAARGLPVPERGPEITEIR